MEILQIVGIGLISAILAAVLKMQKPELAIQLSILTGVLIFMLISGKLMAVIELLTEYTKKVDINPQYISILIRIVGIAYLAQFGAEICKDAGENAIASKIELAGKVIIMIMAVPVITSLLELIIKVMA